MPYVIAVGEVTNRSPVMAIICADVIAEKCKSIKGCDIMCQLLGSKSAKNMDSITPAFQTRSCGWEILNFNPVQNLRPLKYQHQKSPKSLRSTHEHERKIWWWSLHPIPPKMCENANPSSSFLSFPFLPYFILAHLIGPKHFDRFLRLLSQKTWLDVNSFRITQTNFRVLYPLKQPKFTPDAELPNKLEISNYHW
jgi:hypothetical protein